MKLLAALLAASVAFVAAASDVALRDLPPQAQNTLALIKTGKGTAKGQVADAGVEFQRGSKVSVLLAVDEAVTNSALQKGALRRYQFRVVMQKSHGSWYGTTLDLISVVS